MEHGMKHILIGAIVLLVVADFVFWGGPSQLGQHIQDVIGGTASGTARAAGSIGGMIGGTTRAAGNAFGAGLGK